MFHKKDDRLCQGYINLATPAMECQYQLHLLILREASHA